MARIRSQVPPTADSKPQLPHLGAQVNDAPVAFDSLQYSKQKTTSKKLIVFVYMRAAGIEPAPSAWKANILPLNYARNIFPTRL